MEQFKIDVSECTDDEKQQIQERLFEMGCEWRAGAVVQQLLADWYFCGTFLEYTTEPIYTKKYRNLPERPASDFLTRFQTRPHDYTGCHPDIAAALKRGEEILCEVWDSKRENGKTKYVWGFDNQPGYTYRYSTTDLGFSKAKPIPAEPAKKSVTLELTDEQLEKIKGILNE